MNRDNDAAHPTDKQHEEEQGQQDEQHRHEQQQHEQEEQHKESEKTTRDDHNDSGSKRGAMQFPTRGSSRSIATYAVAHQAEPAQPLKPRPTPQLPRQLRPPDDFDTAVARRPPSTSAPSSTNKSPIRKRRRKAGEQDKRMSSPDLTPIRYKKAPGAPTRFRSAFILYSQAKHKEFRERLEVDQPLQVCCDHSYQPDYRSLSTSTIGRYSCSFVRDRAVERGIPRWLLMEESTDILWGSNRRRQRCCSD